MVEWKKINSVIKVQSLKQNTEPQGRDVWEPDKSRQFSLKYYKKGRSKERNVGEDLDEVRSFKGKYNVAS